MDFVQYSLSVAADDEYRAAEKGAREATNALDCAWNANEQALALNAELPERTEVEINERALEEVGARMAIEEARAWREADEARTARLDTEADDNFAPETLALRYSRLCCVCHSDNPRRRAVLVRCGHFTCSPCAEKLAAGPSGHLNCPLCQRKTTFVHTFEELEETPVVRQAPPHCQRRQGCVKRKSGKGSADSSKKPKQEEVKEV